MNLRPKEILDLPDELLDLVFSFLDVADWKRLQLTCKKLSPIAAALCLQNVRFTLSTNGVKRFVKIVKDEKPKFVRTLTHVPIPAWPECSKYEVFERRFRDPERGGIYADGIDEDDFKALEAYEEEQKQNDDEHERLFDEYQAEYERAQTQIRSLASDLYFLEEHHQAEQSPLQQFDKTIKSFGNLQEFVQEPWSQDFDRWWRHLYLEECSDEDEDTEALHLCLILRSLGLALLPSLKYMKFTVRGPAFWTANRLGWLLRNGDHGGLRMIRAYSNVGMVEAEADMVTDGEQLEGSDIIAQDRRKLGNELDVIFNSVRHVLYLDCTVSEDDLQDALLSIAEPVSEFLKRASDLRRLRLAFGTLTEGSPRPDFHCTDGTIRLLALLAENRPWPNLRRLKLAIVIAEQTLLEFLYSIRSTLTRLTLQCVTLAPGKGTWKSTLAKMAEMLPHVRLKLHFLYEFAVSKGGERPAVRVLYPEAGVWREGDVSYSQ